MPDLRNYQDDEHSPIHIIISILNRTAPFLGTAVEDKIIYYATFLPSIQHCSLCASILGTPNLNEKINGSNESKKHIYYSLSTHL
uniref:Uncharacterized protein n=1 Tax=Aegilops tauschii subsp. strangulata TaxID=200361 RepID=A0A453J477_AEGTS